MKATIKNYILASSFFSSLLRAAAFAQVPDPGTPGPLAVTREEYNFGDTAFQPDQLSRTSGAACFDSLSDQSFRWSVSSDCVSTRPPRDLFYWRHALLQWPCTANDSQPIPSFRVTTTFRKFLRVMAMSSSPSVQTESTPSTTPCLISAPWRVRS